mmetsp:Transcript_28183/g.61238  ORF Transcript_28183/g.61238 Transcript_28183/m.61238 type:complete len:355 (-) Transcript_28183:487-1551(-)
MSSAKHKSGDGSTLLASGPQRRKRICFASFAKAALCSARTLSSIKRPSSSESRLSSSSSACCSKELPPCCSPATPVVVVFVFVVVVVPAVRAPSAVPSVCPCAISANASDLPIVLKPLPTGFVLWKCTYSPKFVNFPGITSKAFLEKGLLLLTPFNLTSGVFQKFKVLLLFLLFFLLLVLLGYPWMFRCRACMFLIMVCMLVIVQMLAVITCFQVLVLVWCAEEGMRFVCFLNVPQDHNLGIPAKAVRAHRSLELNPITGHELGYLVEMLVSEEESDVRMFPISNLIAGGIHLNHHDALGLHHHDVETFSNYFYLTLPLEASLSISLLKCLGAGDMVGKLLALRATVEDEIFPS